MKADWRSGRIAANSMWLLVARVLTQALLVALTLIIARRLGEDGLGRYAFIAAVVAVGNTLTTFGLDTALIRQVARARSAAVDLISGALWLQIGLSLVFILAVGAAAVGLPLESAEARLALFAASLSLIPLAFSTVASAILRGFERMDLYLLFLLLTALLQTLGVALALGGGGGLVAISVALVAAQAAGALIAGGLCLWRIPGFALRWRWGWPAVRGAARVGALLALLMALGALYQRLGLLLLPLLAGDSVAGWFSAAARVVEAAKIIPYAAFGALFPAMMQPLAESGRRAGRVWLVVLAAMLAAALILNGLAAPLVRLLYGPRYEPSIPALAILAWTLLPYTLSARLSLDLVTAGQERWAAAATALALGVAVLLYGLLSRSLGLIGACWAALGAESAQAGLMLSARWLARRGRQRLSSSKASYELPEPS